MHPSKLLLLLPIITIVLSISSVNGQQEICFDNNGNFTANSTYQTNLDTLLNSITTTNSGDLTNYGQQEICFDNNGNFTANSTYQTNLDTLLNSITTTNSGDLTNYGLFNASISQQRNSEDVEVIGYCRGDIIGDACRACLYSSAIQVRQKCPIQKRAVFFMDECTLRYSNGSLYGVLDTSGGYLLVNMTIVSNWDTLSAALKPFLDDLRGRAASGGPLRKYAEGGNVSVDLYTLYGTAQCSPDLSDRQCSDCLITITGTLQQGLVGLKTLAPSCQLRYETYSFFDPVAVSVPSPSPAPATIELPPLSVPPELRKKKSSRTWITVVASIASAVLVAGIIAVLLAKRKRLSSQVRRNEDADDVIMVESLQFNLDTIKDATENFSDTRKLGKGGFGSVFRGKLPNGQEIAVKRLAKNSRQGDMEFKNEVVLLAKVQHRNLVRLLGFCFEGDERILIYELMSNSSLDQFIFDPVKRERLDWNTRYKIITGIARGILYLHEDSRVRIIHRDLKASNILLDEDMNPKVSDFGMARLFELDQTQSDTSRIVGTYGYMPPEYVLRGKFSAKSDVFSFGVLVLEIISGRKNLETHHEEDSETEILITNAWRDWRKGKISNIVDPLVSSGYSADISRCIHIGLLCVQDNVTNRPTMTSIVLMLNSNSVTLPVPTQPAFLMNSSYATSEISSTLNRTLMAPQDDNTGTYSVNEVSVT